MSRNAFFVVGRSVCRSRRCGSRAPVSRLRRGMFSALAGCETFRHDPPAAPMATTIAARGVDAAPAPIVPVAPGRYHTRRDYYVVYHDFELDKNDALFTELDRLPEQVFGELKLPPSNVVAEVYLFDTQEHYEAYMQNKWPKLPAARAYFLSQARPGGADELRIYTWLGEHITTDLRHELTHALVAQRAQGRSAMARRGTGRLLRELPPAQDGVNPQHLETLAAPRSSRTWQRGWRNSSRWRRWRSRSTARRGRGSTSCSVAARPREGAVRLPASTPY